MRTITKWPDQVMKSDDTIPERGEGSAWVQWKGTDVCMDVHCRCGTMGHIDASFAYFYKCLKCGVLFAVGQTVRLYPMDSSIVGNHPNFVCDPETIT